MTDSDLGFEFKKDNTRAILLLHGLTGSPFEMKQYGKNLHRAGFDIYCPCLPGHGGTLGDLKGTTWQEWVNFSLNFYKNLKQEYDEVFISGICLGAVLAIYIAQQEKVDGVAALSITLFLDGWSLPWYKVLIPLGFVTVLRYYYDFAEEEPYGIKNETVRKKVVSLLKSNTVALDCFPMACFYELSLLSRQLRNNMAKVKDPLLLIHSQEDDLTSLRGPDFVYKHVSSDIKEYIKLTDSYHLVILDNEKAMVTNKTIEFFNNLSSQSNKESGNIVMNKS